MVNNAIKSRYYVWREILWNGRLRKIVLVIWVLVGVYDLVGNQFYPKLLTISNVLPMDWKMWLIIVLAILLIGLLESVYKSYKIKSKDDWILDYKITYGKLSVLPSYLLPTVPQYSVGTPISKDFKIIPMSGQFWHDLLPSQRKKLLTFVEWLGENPDEYVQQLRKIFPDISLDIGG